MVPTQDKTAVALVHGKGVVALVLDKAVAKEMAAVVQAENNAGTVQEQS